MLRFSSRSSFASLALVQAAALFATGCGPTAAAPLSLPGDAPSLAPSAVDAGPVAVLPTTPPRLDLSNADAGASVPMPAEPPALDPGSADAGSQSDASQDAGANPGSDDAVSPTQDAGLAPPAQGIIAEPSKSDCPAISPTVLFGNQGHIRGLTADADRIYWSSNVYDAVAHGVLRAFPKAGGAVHEVRVAEKGNLSAVTHDGGYLYYTNTGYNDDWSTYARIERIATSAGAAPTVLAEASNGAPIGDFLSVLDGRLVASAYRWNAPNTEVGAVSLPLGGGASQVEFTGFVANDGVVGPYAARNGFWYASAPASGPSTIVHAPKGVSVAAPVATSDGNAIVSGFVSDGSAATFYGEFVPNWPGNTGFPYVDTKGSLKSVTPGSAPVTLAHANHITALALDESQSTLYFAIDFTHGVGMVDAAIVKMPKGGGAITPVVCGLDRFPQQLLVSGSFVYYTMSPSYMNDEIHRAPR